MTTHCRRPITRASGKAAAQSDTGALLAILLDAMVPLRIWELQRDTATLDYLCERGQLEHLAEIIASKGDGIVCRCEHTREAIPALITTVAVLAFQPGGVSVFGLHFAAQRPTDEAPEEDLQ